MRARAQEGEDRMKKDRASSFKLIEKVCPACKGRSLPCQTCDGLGIIYRWEKAN